MDTSQHSDLDPSLEKKEINLLSILKSGGPPQEFHKNKHFLKVLESADGLENLIVDLDKKLNKVLSMQEYEYLKGYNIYIKTKETELRTLIEKLNEKNSNSNNKDKKIASLEQTIRVIR